MIGLMVQVMLVGRCWKLTRNMFVLVASIVSITAAQVAGIYMVGMFIMFLPSNQRGFVIGSNHGFGDKVGICP